MKKNSMNLYQTPQVEMIEVSSSSILCSSGTTEGLVESTGAWGGSNNYDVM